MSEATEAEDFGPGCDCKTLCAMGPTCPGGMLAGLDGSGCWRSPEPDQNDIPIGIRPPGRDSQGRDTRIHGLILDPTNPAISLRELLRQWAASGQDGSPALLKRTEEVLKQVDEDGKVIT